MKTKTILAAISLFIISCEKQESEVTAVSTPDATVPVFDDYFTDTRPSDPQAIHLARENAKPGDELTLSGRIMGRMNLFVEDRAAFILGDPAKLTPCNEKPGDECETPWDTCCDSREAKQIGTATIQIVGENNRVLSGSLKGVNGLTELSSLTVTGIVAPQSTPEALILNATLIHVETP